MTTGQSSGAYQWALTGTFAALQFVFSVLPLFALAGGGGFISVGVVSAPLIGFILGPVYGVVSVVIGSVLGVALLNIGGILGPVIPIVAPAMAAFAAGSLREGKASRVVFVYVVGLAAFIISPIGYIAYSYLWLHLIAFGMTLLLAVPRISGRIKRMMVFGLELRGERLLLPLWSLGFISLLADHLIGGAMASYWLVYAVGLPPEALGPIFVSTAILYPIERLAVSVVLALLLVSVTVALSSGRFGLPWLTQHEHEAATQPPADTAGE